MPRWALPVAVSLVGVAVAVALFSQGGQRSVRLKEDELTVSEVRSGMFRDVVPLNAKIVPHDVIFLDALEGGQVERVFVKPGDVVALGQPIVAFRNTSLELEVLDRQGRLIESITQLQSYEKELEKDRAENAKELARIQYEITRLSRLVERRDALAQVGALSEQQRDEARDQLAYQRRVEPLQASTSRAQEQLRVAQMPSIRKELVNLQSSLLITRSKLEALTVRAPVAGRVTNIDLKIGQNRNRGDRLAEITPDTGFKLSAEVDEFYLQSVYVGQKATVDLDGRSYDLKVERVYPQVQNGRFKVDLDFAGNLPPRLLPGQGAQGELALGRDRAALLLPAGSFLERSGGQWAFVVGKDGRAAERRNIKLGRRSADQVEVLSGLKAGDRVITSDYAGLEKVDRVRISRSGS